MSSPEPHTDAEQWHFPGKDLEIIRRGPKDTAVPLVLVHGVCHGAWCWERYVSFFAEHGYDTTALSLRGHGGSSGRHMLHRFGLDDYVADVADVIAALERKPVLVGHSMGGAIVQRYLVAQPDSVRGAVLFASATTGGLGGRRFLDVLRGNRAASMINALRIVLGRTSTARQANNTPFFGGRLSSADARAYAERLGPESRRAVRDLVRRFSEIPQELPPMLVIGSRGDDLFGEASQRATAAAYQVTPRLLDGLCHDMMLDPEWWLPATHILGFLGELAPSDSVPPDAP